MVKGRLDPADSKLSLRRSPAQNRGQNQVEFQRLARLGLRLISDYGRRT